MGPGTRRQAGHNVAPVSVELLDDQLRNEQLQLLLLDQGPDGRDEALPADVLRGVQPDRGIHEKEQHEQGR